MGTSSGPASGDRIWVRLYGIKHVARCTVDVHSLAITTPEIAWLLQNPTRHRAFRSRAIAFSVDASVASPSRKHFCLKRPSQRPPRRPNRRRRRRTSSSRPMLLRARLPSRLLPTVFAPCRPSPCLRRYSESAGPIAQGPPRPQPTNQVSQAVASAPNSHRGHCGRCHSQYHMHIHSIDALIAAPFPARTHTCAQLSAEHAGSRVVLAGWLLPSRCVSSQRTYPIPCV